MVSPRVFCLVAAALLSGVNSWANSTAFNGYVQTNGNTGIDLTSLNGGNYRVTVTSSGQLNFRYTAGNETFDSNPEAAYLTLTADSPIQFQGDPQPYTADLTIARVNVAPGMLPSYNSSFKLFSSADPVQFLSNVSVEGTDAAPGSGQTQLYFQSDSLYVTGAVNGSSFDIASITPVPLYVAPANFAALAAPSAQSFEFTPFDVGTDNPEPATFALLGGAMLMLGGIYRWRNRAGLR
jgi:hypothetical protein